jgi:hypothetical protein
VTPILDNGGQASALNAGIGTGRPSSWIQMMLAPEPLDAADVSGQAARVKIVSHGDY